MDLILWRHADAEEGGPDLERKLTSKGVKQAARVSEWLQQRLPSKFSLLASPAERARQTAAALGTRARTSRGLSPGASVEDVLDAVDWPARKGAIVVVGHQPTLGRVAARLVAGEDAEWPIKKGGLWWLTHRVRNDVPQVVVRAVIAPDLL